MSSLGKLLIVCCLAASVCSGCCRGRRHSSLYSACVDRDSWCRETDDDDDDWDCGRRHGGDCCQCACECRGGYDNSGLWYGTAAQGDCGCGGMMPAYTGMPGPGCGCAQPVPEPAGCGCGYPGMMMGPGPVGTFAPGPATGMAPSAPYEYYYPGPGAAPAPGSPPATPPAAPAATPMPSSQQSHAAPAVQPALYVPRTI
jgi:hypothetical protein